MARANGVRNVVALAAISVGKEGLLATRRTDRDFGRVVRKSRVAIRHFSDTPHPDQNQGYGWAEFDQIPTLSLSGRVCKWRQKCGILSLDYG